jgi:ABC-type branched-subunit amino acid transport system ATPase component
MKNGSVLKIKNLGKHFAGVKAVDALSLEFLPGKIYGLVGPNGSGKTTLANLLTGIFPWDSGYVDLGEVKLARLPAHQTLAYGITRTFQEVRLFEQMTVLENILVVLSERGVFASLFEAHNTLHQKKAESLLSQFGLLEKQHKQARELSYGQRKLLEIARILAVTADIYFFDEPFAGLFKGMHAKVKQVLADLKAQGKCVVLVEHNMELIRELADVVIVLDSGQLLARGKPEKVLSEKKVLEAYLGD